MMEDQVITTTECPVCHSHVNVVNGRIGFHNEGLRRDGWKLCRGTSKKVDDERPTDS